MPGAKKLPMAPIDRPLSKAYLRKFTGWSTAYPPGMSEPTSLRVMHNCSISPDSSLRIRPGQRRVLSAPAEGPIVGTFEHFFTTDGKKALLFGVRRASDSKVIFRCAVFNTGTGFYDIQPSIATQFPGATDAALAFASDTTYVTYLQIDNKILALSNNTETFRMFWVGATRKAKVVASITTPSYADADKLTIVHPTAAWIAGAQTTVPTAETATTTTLIHSTPASNTYNFGFFYTFNNEIGESAPSRITTIKTQRRWSAWQANATSDQLSADQLVAIMPSAVWTAAAAQGAVSWNLYMFTWSDQEPVPVEGVMLKSIEIPTYTYAQHGWGSMTPLLQGTDSTKSLPSASNRLNFSEPSAAGQGIVAGDRLVLVHDKVNNARIQWSSNQLGEYINFGSSVGGGFKTLTSGNLMHPACVKLWQNPQSVDTLTILCQGIDGYGTAYYMAPGSQVTTQSQAAVIMGFEETTATPGTVSPYGNEVLNNALYHPLENNLMKSSASNYNINHLLVADKIQNAWREITSADKQKIISSQMDSTLYYLVNSSLGTLDADGAAGNQIWTCDTALTNIWSCWDIVGTSLHKLEFGGLLYMSVVSGPSIFVFDPEWDHDDVWDGDSWVEAGIPWEIVTNTQGANRSHDAWCHLQQIQVTFGNFTGECIYGVRGKDINGKPVDIPKHFIAPVRGHSPLDRYDQIDYLLIRRQMVEWEFYWRSADRPKNRSYGSVNFVQYRYTPVTVNVGYEYGSVETFEYGQRNAETINGVPVPFADTSKA